MPPTPHCSLRTARSANSSRTTPAHGQGVWTRQIHGSEGLTRIAPRPLRAAHHSPQEWTGRSATKACSHLVPDFHLEPITAALFGGERLWGYDFPFQRNRPQADRNRVRRVGPGHRKRRLDRGGCKPRARVQWRSLTPCWNPKRAGRSCPDYGGGAGGGGRRLPTGDRRRVGVGVGPCRRATAVGAGINLITNDVVVMLALQWAPVGWRLQNHKLRIRG